MNPSGASYQRKYLRAPYKREILFQDENFIFKAQTLNISEGGLLLEHTGHFPEASHIAFMLEVPEFPLFKNHTLEKLQVFTVENIHSRIIRFKAKMVRSTQNESSIDGMFASRIGISISDIKPNDQLKILNYVETFSSNLVYLQVLIDSLTADERQLKKIRLLTHILGYDSKAKISYLRKVVEQDYKSLQWL